jgi:hypothetical protein
LSNVVPFALFDVLLAVLIGGWIWTLVRDISRRSGGSAMEWVRLVGRVTVRTLTLVAGLYVVFLVTWGFNYRRQPLSTRLATNEAGVTPDAARGLVMSSIAELNRLYAPAHQTIASRTSSNVVDESLAGAFASAQNALGVRTTARVARPKRSLLDMYFLSAGVSGMTDPYFLETLVASDLLPVERPFVVAHEWSHLAGFADEGEANFVGWVTCLRGSPLDQYAGWLFLYDEALSGLSRSARGEAARRLDPGPRDDLRAIVDRVQRHVRPAVSNAGWRVYDRYLKANRVEAGTASYREVVRLVLQTRFDAKWTPQLK